MGCVSSKVFRRSDSFREETNQKCEKRYTVLEELLASSCRGDDNLLAFLAAANIVSKRIKLAASLFEETETSMDSEKQKCIQESSSIEKKEIKIDEYKFVANCEPTTMIYNRRIARARKFYTVEDYDAFLAATRKSEECFAVQDFDQLLTKNDNSVGHQILNTYVQIDYDENFEWKSAKKVERTKPSSVLETTSPGFSKSGSFRFWLRKGESTARECGVKTNLGASDAFEFKVGVAAEYHDAQVFDPDMIAQLEKALDQLRTDEELVLMHIERLVEPEQLDESSGKNNYIAANKSRILGNIIFYHFNVLMCTI